MDKPHEKTNKKRGTFYLFVTAACSWILTAIFGIILLVIALGTSALLVSTDNDASAKPGVVYGLLTVPLLIALIVSIKKDSWLFFRYCKIPLMIGATINGLIFIVSLVSLLGSNYFVTTNQQCSSLDQQFEITQSATVPIGTNLGAGTAFAVGDATTLVTAYHVIEGATEIYGNYVTGKIPVTIKAVAPDIDLALLTIAQPTSNFLTLTNNYQVASPLYAYGYPGNNFDAGQASVSSGIVSRILTRDDLKLNGLEAADHHEIIQTDAALNPGNSGGAIINRCGVIGVVSSGSDVAQLHQHLGIASEQGIGYAISSKTISKQFGLPISGN